MKKFLVCLILLLPLLGCTHTESTIPLVEYDELKTNYNQLALEVVACKHQISILESRLATTEAERDAVVKDFELFIHPKAAGGLRGRLYSVSIQVGYYTNPIIRDRIYLCFNSAYGPSISGFSNLANYDYIQVGRDYEVIYTAIEHPARIREVALIIASIRELKQGN